MGKSTPQWPKILKTTIFQVGTLFIADIDIEESKNNWTYNRLHNLWNFCMLSAIIKKVAFSDYLKSRCFMFTLLYYFFSAY